MQAGELLCSEFGAGPEKAVAAPGRVNLIGEHIDYHGLPVLPIALGQRIRIAYRPRRDSLIRAVSEGYGRREFHWAPKLDPVASGDWENYLRAAARAVAGKWGIGCGVDAAISSDLPSAAGLSSSSALLVAFAMALLDANGVRASYGEFMQALPEGEQFVGTRGGGMDHAVSLGARAGCALLIEFEPLETRPVPIPEDWGFLIAHCGKAAEKSGAVREEYNARRTAGAAALARRGLRSYKEALAAGADNRFASPAIPAAQNRMDCPGDGVPPFEEAAFAHVTGEARRVLDAVNAVRNRDAQAFGKLLVESHYSLRHLLKVSCAELDQLVDAAMASGALGAKLTGAGFGGCVVIFALRRDLAGVRQGLVERFYKGAPPAAMFEAQPGAGALFTENP